MGPATYYRNPLALFDLFHGHFKAKSWPLAPLSLFFQPNDPSLPKFVCLPPEPFMDPSPKSYSNVVGWGRSEFPGNETNCVTNQHGPQASLGVVLIL